MVKNDELTKAVGLTILLGNIKFWGILKEREIKIRLKNNKHNYLIVCKFCSI